eukprot:g5406.t1
MEVEMSSSKGLEEEEEGVEKDGEEEELSPGKKKWAKLSQAVTGTSMHSIDIQSVKHAFLDLDRLAQKHPKHEMSSAKCCLFANGAIYLLPSIVAALFLVVPFNPSQRKTWNQGNITIFGTWWFVFSILGNLATMQLFSTVIPFRKRVQLLISVVSTLVMLVAAVVTAAVVGKTKFRSCILAAVASTSFGAIGWLCIGALVLWRGYRLLDLARKDIDHLLQRNSNIEDFISAAQQKSTRRSNFVFATLGRIRSISRDAVRGAADKIVLDAKDVQNSQVMHSKVQHVDNLVASMWRQVHHQSVNAATDAGLIRKGGEPCESSGSGDDEGRVENEDEGQGKSGDSQSRSQSSEAEAEVEVEADVDVNAEAEIETKVETKVEAETEAEDKAETETNDKAETEAKDNAEAEERRKLSYSVRVQIDEGIRHIFDVFRKQKLAQVRNALLIAFIIYCLHWCLQIFTAWWIHGKRQQDATLKLVQTIIYNILVYGLEWLALLVSDATDCAQINTAVPGSLVEEARRSEDDFFLFRMSIRTSWYFHVMRRAFYIPLFSETVGWLDWTSQTAATAACTISMQFFMRTEKYYRMMKWLSSKLWPDYTYRSRKCMLQYAALSNYFSGTTAVMGLMQFAVSFPFYKSTYNASSFPYFDSVKWEILGYISVWVAFQVLVTVSVAIYERVRQYGTYFKIAAQGKHGTARISEDTGEWSYIPSTESSSQGEEDDEFSVAIVDDRGSEKIRRVTISPSEGPLTGKMDTWIDRYTIQGEVVLQHFFQTGDDTFFAILVIGCYTLLTPAYALVLHNLSTEECSSIIEPVHGSGIGGGGNAAGFAKNFTLN